MITAHQRSPFPSARPTGGAPPPGATVCSNFAGFLAASYIFASSTEDARGAVRCAATLALRQAVHFSGVRCFCHCTAAIPHRNRGFAREAPLRETAMRNAVWGVSLQRRDFVWGDSLGMVTVTDLEDRRWVKVQSSRYFARTRHGQLRANWSPKV